MTGLVLYPPEILAPTPAEGPMIFLAGPIQGASDWQSEAIKVIHRLAPELHIANPRRGTFPPTDKNFNEQVDWETFHLRRSAANGVVLFWLANEAEHFCGRAYAQTTRFELAEWKVNYQTGVCKLAIGIDTSFTGARYIRRRLAQDCPQLPIYESLEATCMEAAELSRRGYGG